MSQPQLSFANPATRAAILGALATSRTGLAERYNGLSSGRELGWALSDTMDMAIQALLEGADPTGWAFVATGGYGRRELSPHSDIDLTLLCYRRGPDIDQMANGVFYALWDATLETTSSVRTLDECVSLAASDLATQTACLQSRLLAGDSRLFADFQRRVLADARRKDSKPFLQALLNERRLRHERSTEALYGLEPDLKEGRGGLRDAVGMIWAGFVALKTASLQGLAQQGYLATDEELAVEHATDYLMRVRNHLHYLAGRKADRLFFSYQQDTATFLGYLGTNGHLPVQRFMRDLNAHAGAISRAADGFWEHIEDNVLAARSWPIPAPVGPFQANGGLAEYSLIAQRGRLHLADGAMPAVHPEAALAIFGEAARRGARVSHTVTRQIRKSLADVLAPVRWTDAARDSFLTVLRAGGSAAYLLEEMAGSGLLTIYLPEWNEVAYLAHHDIYHLHTVDRHLMLVVNELSRLVAGDEDSDTLVTSVAGEVADADSLLLAGLLHDIGKGDKGDHSQVGAIMAADIATRMGVAAATAETVGILVEHHLLLARAATRRDLDDEAVVRKVAESAGTADRLRMLYLLTVADSRCTGPSAWTDWKASLVRELFVRTMKLFDQPDRGASLEARLMARRDRLSAVLGKLGSAEQAHRFLGSFPASYLMSQPDALVERHFALWRDTPPEELGIRFDRAVDAMHTELTLIAPDRAGLLWRVCGVFAIHGLDILEARVHTDNDGRALDIFRLADTFEPEISEEKRQRVRRDLGLAIDGRLSLSYRLSRKLKSYRALHTTPVGPPRVNIDNTASSDYTVVEVHARDRLGLLYTIARGFSELHVDIHLAKVSTRGAEAIDVFYVRDVRGEKITDSEHIAEIERGLLYELDELESRA